MQKVQVIIIFCFSLLNILAQDYVKDSPEWLVISFFQQESFPDKSRYYTGEMINDVENLTIGEEINGKGEIKFHKIKDTNDECVFSVEVSIDNKVIDFYCFLVGQTGIWKINAVRRFLLPAFIYMAYDSLSNLSSLSANDSTFYLSLKLFTMNDSELKNYLNLHLRELQELIRYFDEDHSVEIKKGLTSLGCSAVFKDRNYPGCVFVQILAFEKMEAGFIYNTEPSELPKVSPKGFICVEEVAPGWFIYRMI
ncbi:MAG: hypothetical protein WBQ32_08265 [Ignavibacteriaceae bacterium]